MRPAVFGREHRYRHGRADRNAAAAMRAAVFGREHLRRQRDGRQPEPAAMRPAVFGREHWIRSILRFLGELGRNEARRFRAGAPARTDLKAHATACRNEARRFGREHIPWDWVTSGTVTPQ